MKLKLRIKNRHTRYTHVGNIHLPTPAGQARVILIRRLRETAKGFVDSAGTRFNGRTGKAIRAEGLLDLKTVSKVRILEDAPVSLKEFYAK